MTKTLDDLLDLPESVFAPSGRGWVNVNIMTCLICEQADPEKVVLLNVGEEIIKHPWDPGQNHSGKVFELKCNQCGGRYKLGIIKVEAATASGEKSTMYSLFMKSDANINIWKWVGCF
ncbi:MAG: hypothetical protein ACTSRA_19115 [Promethearchaeota archaeon]